MLLEQCNEAARVELEKVLRPCLDIQRWIDGIIDDRPYSSREALLDSARIAADPFTIPEIESALAHHPRIGQKAAGTSTEAKLSAAEQARVSGEDPAILAAIAEGNAAYESKFGRVFLIRAAGRSATDILGSLNKRLENPPEVELAVVAQQLREIAVLRLEGAVAA
ncbi:2-oxo-4-hydroxy-4-carboxy-5-ureidoimidazoline decarboxylase [Arthrobacter sp. 35W]|uniref:2-oxo-4-hydroxy-4-carboxy-5-ureidoimidazoline decarboxylase n=1 Tax=Arthrobacter sp. 35W TaxID=1132441 RepID=UPI000413335E|nr:2-oxo-4-hydroxy-4-carboxy-5-ureidoimidazoline decarboxylase [Arthrobacter sp. 35W]